MDINQANGNFIVGNNNYWYKFNLGRRTRLHSRHSRTTTMVGPTGQSNWSDVAVDNSGGAGGVGEGEQGRIYGMSEGEGTIKGWKANGEPVSGGFAPPSGVGYGGAVRLRRRLRRGRLGRQLDRWPDLRSSTRTEPRPGILSTVGKVGLRHGDRRRRKLLHQSTTAAKRRLEIQPDR